MFPPSFVKFKTFQGGPILKNDKFFKISKNTFFGTLKYVQNDGKTHSSQKY